MEVKEGSKVSQIAGPKNIWKSSERVQTNEPFLNKQHTFQSS